MDYTLNIVSKCRFFFIFKHSRAPKRSWKIFHGVLVKSWIFLSIEEWEPCVWSHGDLHDGFISERGRLSDRMVEIAETQAEMDAVGSSSPPPSSAMRMDEIVKQNGDVTTQTQQLDSAAAAADRDDAAPTPTGTSGCRPASAINGTSTCFL